MRLEGTVLHVERFGEWAKATLRTAAGDLVQIVGRPVVRMTETGDYVLEGSKQLHRRWGEQFEVQSARLSEDKTRARVLDELERSYAGCGGKTATRVVGAFEASRGGLQELLEIVTRRPWELEKNLEVVGKHITYLKPIDRLAQERLAMSLAARAKGCAQAGLSSTLSEWWCRRNGSPERGREIDSLMEMAQNPYEAIGQVKGYGFAQAEELAEGLDVPWNAPARLAAVARHVVEELCARGGHSYVSQEQLDQAARDLEPRAQKGECLEAVRRSGGGLSIDGVRVYPSRTLEEEVHVAKHLSAMLEPGEPLWTLAMGDLDERLEFLANDVSLRLDAQQRAAVKGVLRSKVRLHTLTAGPGCGKTTVMEAVAAMLPDVRFAAPTGKAAKVLQARVGKYGQTATTVHALLEAHGDSFGRGALSPLAATLIVVDEASMQDLSTMSALISAMTRSTHLLLVGDEEQLDSVGVGRVLQDILSIPAADHQRLLTSHRAGAGLNSFLSEIRRGCVPATPGTDEVKHLVLGDDNPESFGKLERLWLQSIESWGMENVAVLFGYRHATARRQTMNVSYANERLRDAANPERGTEDVPGTRFRIGDRVIVRKNLTLRRKGPGNQDIVYGHVVNGDTGCLVGQGKPSANMDRYLLLRMDDGREVNFPIWAADKLDLAYAQTIHAAQGSEFMDVIVCLSGQPNDFMNRRLIYTGCSRAKRHLTLVGTHAELCAIAEHVGKARQSWLAQRVADQA